LHWVLRACCGAWVVTDISCPPQYWPLFVETINTSRFLESASVVSVIVCPKKSPRLAHDVAAKVSKRTHLAVEVRVSEQELFALKLAKVSVGPIKTEGNLGLSHEPPLVS